MSKQKENGEVHFNDYEASPVPEDKHMSWLSQGAVWVGVGFCLAAISTGGVLANGLGFKGMVLATICGGLILTLIACFVGIVGATTHLPSAMTTRFSFGTNGARIFGLILAFCNFGWFAFQADLFGSTVVTLLKQMTGADVPQVLCTVLGALAMMITAIIGFRGIKWLSNVAVPLLFVLSIVAVVMTLQRIPFSEITACGPVDVAIPFTVGVAAVVGNSAVGVVIVSDFTRYSAKKSDAVKGCILGYFVGYVPILLMGGLFTYAFNTWNVVEVMLVELGMGMIGAFVLILAQWTTNDNNLYQSVLGLSNVLAGKVPYVRWKLTLVVGLISTVISSFGLVARYTGFLSILTATIPAVGGIIISDFYFLNKNGYDFALIEKDLLPKWKWNAIIAWGVAILVGLSMNTPPTGFGVPFMVALSTVVPTPIVGMVVAFVMNMILYPVFNKKATA